MYPAEEYEARPGHRLNLTGNALLVDWRANLLRFAVADDTWDFIPLPVGCGHRRATLHKWLYRKRPGERPFASSTDILEASSLPINSAVSVAEAACI